MEDLVRDALLDTLHKAGFDAEPKRAVWWIFKKDRPKSGVYIQVGTLEEHLNDGTLMEYIQRFARGVINASHN
jgi:hypothetical protein